MMKPKLISKITPQCLILGLVLILSACSLPATPSPTVDVGQFYTQAAATINIGLTETTQAQPSATLPPPTATTEPSATPTQIPQPVQPLPQETPTPRPQPAPPTFTAVPVNPTTAHGCYNATFLADVTIQFAPNFNPGDRFTKTWRVKNTGTCDWPRGFLIAYVSGDRFGAETKAIDQKVAAGDTAEISLVMTAPNSTGQVSSHWQLTTDIGKPFGPILSASITLPAAGSSTSTTGSGCLNSALISDVTIPTGTELQPKESFTKTWLIKNTGTCAWNRDFKIKYIGGDLLGSDTSKIRKDVPSGASIEVSLNMVAPDQTGIFNTAWQLAADNDQLFGQLFSFSIVVK